MDTPTEIFTEIECAEIEADELAKLFNDHRATMDQTSPVDLLRERQLYAAAWDAAAKVAKLQSFQAHADQAIDLTGGQR